MNISAPFIRRPVMTTLLTLGLVIFGLAAYRELPLSDLPNVDFPTILVTAALPGATPETMAAAVATPLEREFSTIAGLSNMSSASSTSSTAIVLQFDLSRDIDGATTDVQAAISRAGGFLPPELPAPPSFQKVNPADQPILYLAVTAPSLPVYELDRYAQTLMAQQISTVSGVAQVLVFGSQKYAVRVQLDPSELASRDIGLNEVAAAVAAANVNLPTGTLDGRHQAYTVQATGQLRHAEAYRPIIVAYRDGHPVRLEELGRVVDSVQNDKAIAWFNGERGEVLAIQRQPGANTVRVARAVRELLPRLRQQVPAAVTIDVVYDRSETIRASVNDVQFTLLFTLALVVLVIFAFLRNAQATLIPSLAMPLSLLGTFTVMYLLGYSLNNLSLMALTLSVGFVVDDAIVVLENIVRHLERKERPLTASLSGSGEIGFTIVSMTLSLSAVFIPVLLLGGIVGRLFREFSVTIGVAVLISGVVSLTLTPMMCSRFLRPAGEQRHGRLYRSSERGFDALQGLYARSLRWSLRHRLLIMLVAAGSVVATAVLFVVVPKGFLPTEDAGQVIVWTEGAESSSFASMVEHQQAVAAVVARDPNAESWVSVIGGRVGMGGVNTGFVFIRLRPRGQRLPAEEVVARLRPELSRIPGIRTFLQVPALIQVGGRLTRGLYQVTLQATDLEELYRVGQELEKRLLRLPELIDVSSDLRIANPEANLLIARDRAATLQVSAAAIEEALFSAYSDRRVSTIYAPEDTYWVILELLKSKQQEPADLSLLWVRSAAGMLVPLLSVADLQLGVGPLTVNHTGQLASVTVSFNLPPGVALGTAVERVEEELQDLVPPGIVSSFQGAAQVFQASLGNLGLLLLLAVVVIYLVLGVLYESFVHPVTILSALPLAGLGALLALLVFRTDLDLYAFVGIIMLVGLVKKNGIMMIDFALVAQAADRLPPAEAIYRASLVRFRPIMMTTMAVLFGSLPLAVGIGAGAESRRPLGLAVVGGLLFSQMLTLFVTPVFYVYMDRLQLELRKWFKFLGTKEQTGGEGGAEGRGGGGEGGDGEGGDGEGGGGEGGGGEGGGGEGGDGKGGTSGTSPGR